MASNPLLPLTNQINKDLRCMGLPRIRFTFVGSFVSLRIEDPEGEISVKEFQVVMVEAGKLLQDHKIVTYAATLGHGYLMNGVVATWSRNY